MFQCNKGPKMFYLLAVILVLLMFGKTGKLLRYGLLKTFLFIVAYLSIPLLIIFFRF
jgi:hypothetical protein